MDADLKAKWVAALRSGEYQQGQTRLKRTIGDTAKYCCLGVLCDLLDHDGWSEDDDHTDTNPHSTQRMWRFTYKGQCHQSLLPHNLSEEIGIDTNTQWSLCDMNDGKPYLEPSKFSVIADYIESKL